MKNKTYCRLAAPILLPLLLLTSCGDGSGLPKAPVIELKGTKQEATQESITETLGDKLYTESTAGNYYRFQIYQEMQIQGVSSVTRMVYDFDPAQGFYIHGEVEAAGVKGDVKITALLESNVVYYLVSAQGTTIKQKYNLDSFDAVQLPDFSGDDIYSNQLNDALEMIDTMSSLYKINFDLFTYDSDKTFTIAAVDKTNENNILTVDFDKKEDKYLMVGSSAIIRGTDASSMIYSIKMKSLDSKPTSIKVPSDADQYLQQ